MESNSSDDETIEREDESSFTASGFEEEDSEDELEIRSRTRNILFLCQEGQLRIARRRFELLKNNNLHENKTDNPRTLQKEIFQVARDKNYPLHEILIGGTSDRNASLLSMEILETASSVASMKIPLQTMLIAQPPSHNRTCLHWAAWGNASLSLLRALVIGNPEALIRKDKPDKGNRTPSKIYRRYYYPGECERADDKEGTSTKEKLNFLESSTKRWIQHRLRLAIHGAVVLYFREQSLTPFDKNDRKRVKIKPRPWYIMSILGYFLQRKMQPLLLLTLSFVGQDAKVHGKKRKRKAIR